MRKLLLVLICLAMAFSLVSCGMDYGKYYDDYIANKNNGYDMDGNFVFLNNQTSATLYNSERNRILELEACTLKYEEKVTFDYNGETISNNKIVTFYKSGANEEYYCVKEGFLKTEGWYIDGVYYENDNGVKHKEVASEFAYYEYCRPKEADLGNFLANFPFEWIDYKEYKECQDGYYIIFNHKGAQYRENFVDSFISDLYQGMDEIEHKIYFSKEGILTGIEISVSYNSGGAKANAKIKVVITEDNVPLPAINTDEYK